MSPDSTKPFGPIRGDYSFFVAHATEAAEDLCAYRPHLAPLASGDGPVRVLDFGCGDGGFSAQFLAQCPVPPPRLSLSLVEPDDAYRRLASERLAPFSARPVRAWPALPADPGGPFDLVLANHVLYYVADLGATLAALLRSLSARGLFLTAMAGQENGLVQFWARCFALIGKPVPFHIAEDFRAALDRLGEPYSAEEVWYELAFPDGEDNRMSILRFLLGGYFGEVPRQAMLDLFDPYAAGGRVHMRLTHEHFVVRREAGAAEAGA
jgi:SAM-dependent methyltransferase